MSDQKDRLKVAREEAGYQTAADAARAMGMREASYHHHENGYAGLSRAGHRYAKFFNVNYEWLMTGRGEMKPKAGPVLTLKVDGFVGNGARVDMPDQPPVDPPYSELSFDPQNVGLLVVSGLSNYPRFIEGEAIMYDRRPASPSTLIDRYAIVQDADGQRMLKILRRGSREGLFSLESHNQAPLRDVEVLMAWRYLGVLSGK